MDTQSPHPPFTPVVGPRCRRAAMLLAAVVWFACRSACAAPCPAADVWVASTRRLPGVCGVPRQAAVDVERLSGGDCGRWERAGLDDLLAEPQRPLVVFIHGNRYAAAEARSQGLRLARLIAATCPDAGPVRTLIFSWPSEQQGLLLRDVRAKYDRAHADGHYLAWLLARVEPDRPVAVVGYSYGALVGLVALDDLASAERDGAPAWAARTARTHLVCVVPAVRCDALAPRGPHRESLAGVDRFTLVVNSDDHALRFFEYVDRGARAEALGTTSMPRHWVPAGVEYSAVDAACVVGHGHPLPLYLDAPGIARRITAGAVSGLDAPRAE